MLDSRPTVAWPPTTVAWPFGEFFPKSFLIAWNVQKRCLTVSRRSRDLRPLSRDRSATFFKFFSNCLKRPKTLFDSRPTVAWPQPLSRDRSATFFKVFPNRLKRPKNVVWHSSDGRVTSDHCRVTVQRLFSKFSQIAWNVQKTLFDSQPTVAWPPITVAWPFSDFFQNFPKSLETSRKRCLTVGRRSRDLRLLSRDRLVTFFKKISNFIETSKKTWFDSRPTVAWPPTTVAWPFSDFFQNFPKSLETSKKRCLTVGRRSRDPNHCRVTVQRLFSKIFLIAWNVEKTLFDSQPTVAWPPTTVAWPFSDFFQNFPKSLETSRKRCLTVGRRSRDLRLLSRDRSVTFFKNFPNCLKRPKNVVWQSADGRVTSDHCRVTVQRLFSKFSQIAWNVQKTLFDSRPTVAWPPTTVAWPFSDFFQKNF